MWFPRTAPEKFRIRLPPAVSLRTIGSAVGEPVLASKNLRRPQGSVRDVALCGDRRRRPRDASHQILIGQLVNRDWYLLSECLQGGRIPPSVDSSQATGRVKRRDNQLHRARVLEVRIPLAPAVSQQTFSVPLKTMPVVRSRDLIAIEGPLDSMHGCKPGAAMRHPQSARGTPPDWYG